LTTTTDIRMGLVPGDSQDSMPGDSVDVSDFTFDEVDALLPVGETTGDKAAPTSSPLESTSAGLHINLIPEASVSNAPSWFVPSVQTAADMLEQAYSDNITLNITYGWGTIGGSAITNANTALGGANGFNVAYSTVKSWLGADAKSADDASAIASLPTSTSAFPNNRGFFGVSTAQEKALGHFTGDPSAIDGQIGFGTGWTSGAIIGAALHELTHAMGRVSGWNMDMFRFSAPGAYQFTLGQAAYFSINGGNTHLANFGRTSDTGDWLSNGNSAAPFTTNDPFNESINSSSNALTAVDLTIMDILGFDRAGTAPPPDDYADSLADSTSPFGQVAVNGASTGTLEVTGDRDWFTVQLTAGWSYLFNLEGAPTAAGTLSDPYLRFHDSAGAVLAQNDDVSSSNLNSQVAFVATASGTYYLEAGAFSDMGAGTYRMSISGTAPTVQPPTTPPPTTLPSGPSSTPAALNTIARPVDFNGDGHDDLLWTTEAGQAVTWHMNGSQITSTQTIGSAGFAWHVAGTGDFNGNGQDDILWRSDSGQVVTWLISGGQLASATAVGSAAAGWHIIGTGDFNGDGRDDILWHSDTGQVSTWLMNGGQISSVTSVGSAPMSAHIAETGDFNGDGRTDILWRSENGQVSTWLMNGGQIASATTIGTAGAAWHIAATGDLNGDGREDIIWRNEDGRVSTWLMNGGQLLTAGDSGSTATAWHIIGTGDLTGDGRDEILWRNDDGHVADWVMNATQLASAADLGSLPTTSHIGGSQFDLV
jgi:hypothetical protein